MKTSKRAKVGSKDSSREINFFLKVNNEEIGTKF